MSIFASTGTVSNTTVQRTKVLYLVLHGLITLVDLGRKGFTAHLLDMQNEHKYKFGRWLLEQDIPVRTAGQTPPTASLTGVDQGDAVMDSDKDAIIVSNSAPDDSDPSVRAVMELPRPTTIFYFRSGNLTPASLVGDTSVLQKVPAQISQVRVFKYVFQDITKISLDFGSGVEATPPSLAFADKLAVTALHVYNEPDAPLPPSSDHNDREFSLSTTFLGDPQLQLANDPNAGFANDPDAPPGLLPEEILSLAEREIAILNIVLDARVQQFGRATGLAINRPPGSGLCATAHAIVKAT